MFGEAAVSSVGRIRPKTSAGSCLRRPARAARFVGASGRPANTWPICRLSAEIIWAKGSARLIPAKAACRLPLGLRRALVIRFMVFL